MIKFEHPTIQIQTPAPGHYVIVGHNPGTTYMEGVGHVVPSQECYISPQVPNEALLAVLEDRGALEDPGDVFEDVRNELQAQIDKLRAENEQLQADLDKATTPKGGKK